MRIALIHEGMARGLPVLLRGRGSRPFSSADAVMAGRLSTPLAAR
ncbi:hypothetical protein ACH5A3_09270 [Streptomyces echinatus]